MLKKIANHIATLVTNAIREKNISFAKCEGCEEFKVHLKSEGKKGTSMMLYTILKILKDALIVLGYLGH